MPSKKNRVSHAQVYAKKMASPVSKKISHLMHEGKPQKEGAEAEEALARRERHVLRRGAEEEGTLMAAWVDPDMAPVIGGLGMGTPLPQRGRPTARPIGFVRPEVAMGRNTMSGKKRGQTKPGGSKKGGKGY